MGWKGVAEEEGLWRRWETCLFVLLYDFDGVVSWSVVYLLVCGGTFYCTCSESL